MAKVHFTVDFDWLTEHCRNLWAEASFDKAIETLEAAGVPTLHYCHEIIRGNLKMIQDPNGKPGIDGMLAKDNWEPNLNRCHLSEYPDPDIVDRIVEERRLEKLDKETDLLVDMIKRWNMNVKRQRNENLEDIRRVFRNISEDAFNELGYNKEDILSTYYYEIDEPYSNPKQDNIDKILARAEEALSTNVIAFVDYTLTSPYGFISPSGKFYPCNWMQHDALAIELGSTKDNLLNNGWVAITERIMTGETEFYTESDTVSQKVIDTLFDWSQKHDKLVVFEEFNRLHGE